MKRAPLRTSGYKRGEYVYAPRQRDREPGTITRMAQAVVYARIGDTATPVPKPESGRNPRLLALAKGRRCLLLAVEGCEGASGLSTVACHQNEGKGMGLKRPDAYSCWGCGPCHHWYDFSGSPRAEKRRAFDAAHKRQIAAWRVIADNSAESPADRAAARWALEQQKGST